MNPTSPPPDGVLAVDPAVAAAICPSGPAPPRIWEKSVAKGLAEMEPCCVAVVLVSARDVVSLALRWGVPPGCCELRSDTGGPTEERERPTSILKKQELMMGGQSMKVQAVCRCTCAYVNVLQMPDKRNGRIAVLQSEIQEEFGFTDL